MVRFAPQLELLPDWRAFLARVLREEDIKFLRAHERTGRPLGRRGISDHSGTRPGADYITAETSPQGKAGDFGIVGLDCTDCAGSRIEILSLSGATLCTIIESPWLSC